MTEASGRSSSEISVAVPRPSVAGSVRWVADSAASAAAIVVFRCRFLAIKRSSGDSFGVGGAAGVAADGSVVAALRLDADRNKLFLTVVVGLTAGVPEVPEVTEGMGSEVVSGAGLILILKN